MNLKSPRGIGYQRKLEKANYGYPPPISRALTTAPVEGPLIELGISISNPYSDWIVSPTILRFCEVRTVPNLIGPRRIAQRTSAIHKKHRRKGMRDIPDMDMMVFRLIAYFSEGESACVFFVGIPACVSMKDKQDEPSQPSTEVHMHLRQ